MAITRIASQDAKGTGSASCSATYSGPTTPGDLLIASAYGNVSTDVLTLTAGWNPRQFNLGTGNTVKVWDKIADGTEGLVSLSGSSTTSRLHIYEYTANAKPVATDGINTGSAGAATTAISASITTTTPNDLIFVSMIQSNAVTGVSVNSPFSLRQVDTTIRLMDADQIVSATGSYAATFNWTTSSNTRSIIIAYKANTGNFLPFM